MTFIQLEVVSSSHMRCQCDSIWIYFRAVCTLEYFSLILVNCHVLMRSDFISEWSAAILASNSWLLHTAMFLQVPPQTGQRIVDSGANMKKLVDFVVREQISHEWVGKFSTPNCVLWKYSYCLTFRIWLKRWSYRFPQIWHLYRLLPTCAVKMWFRSADRRRYYLLQMSHTNRLGALQEESLVAFIATDNAK